MRPGSEDWRSRKPEPAHGLVASSRPPPNIARKPPHHARAANACAPMPRHAAGRLSKRPLASRPSAEASRPSAGGALPRTQPIACRTHPVSLPTTVRRARAAFQHALPAATACESGHSRMMASKMSRTFSGTANGQAGLGRFCLLRSKRFRPTAVTCPPHSKFALMFQW
jgi:hypothetical protein